MVRAVRLLLRAGRSGRGGGRGVDGGMVEGQDSRQEGKGVHHSRGL